MEKSLTTEYPDIRTRAQQDAHGSQVVTSACFVERRVEKTHVTDGRSVADHPLSLALFPLCTALISPLESPVFSASRGWPMLPHERQAGSSRRGD